MKQVEQIFPPSHTKSDNWLLLLICGLLDIKILSDINIYILYKIWYIKYTEFSSSQRIFRNKHLFHVLQQEKFICYFHKHPMGHKLKHNPASINHQQLEAESLGKTRYLGYRTC